MTKAKNVEHYDDEPEQAEPPVVDNVVAMGGNMLTPAEYRNLSDLWHMKKSSADAFNAAGNALAEKKGLHAAELKAYVAAKEQDKLDEYEKKMETRQVLLDL